MRKKTDTANATTSADNEYNIPYRIRNFQSIFVFTVIIWHILFIWIQLAMPIKAHQIPKEEQQPKFTSCQNAQPKHCNAEVMGLTNVSWLPNSFPANLLKQKFFDPYEQPEKQKRTKKN